MAKRALITGITGQDGAYLAKLLLEKGYEVHGAYRRSGSLSVWRLKEVGVLDQIKLIPIEMLELSNIARVLEKVEPDEVYNLAAQSFVALSFEQPLYTCDVDGMGVGRLLEAIRSVNSKIKMYQASSSEMFGKVTSSPQNESTPFYPRSPYGVAKLFAHWMTVNYREAHRMFAVSGILFNHESPLRGLEFVTRKITAGLARIRRGEQSELALGNLSAQRDWGFAGDYMQAVHLMMQQNTPSDYVVASGATHSVRAFVEKAAHALDFNIVWEGEGAAEIGIDRSMGKVIIRVSPEFWRPAEVDVLHGDASRAAKQLGWKPSVSFEQLVEMMVRADHDRARRGDLPPM